MFDSNVINELKELLISNKETVSVAESVTSGFMQAALSTAENASQCFEGGLTAYNLEQKVEHLEVERSHAEQVDCVSEKVSEEMALQCVKLFKSTWAIAITGYASPVPEGDNKLFAFFAIAKNGTIVLQERIESNRPAGVDTQLYYTTEVLKNFLQVVKKENAPMTGAING